MHKLQQQVNRDGSKGHIIKYSRTDNMKHFYIFFFVYILLTKFTDLDARVVKKSVGGCYSSYENIGYMIFGEEKQVKGLCMKASCHFNQVVELSKCQSLSDYSLQSCKVVIDTSKPYPHCCPREICN